MGGRLRKAVVMVGMMGAGKTAVGQAVARALSAPFLDSDEEIVRAARATIADIFARDGEAFFRARESQVLERLLRGGPAVISTGGGAYLRPENRAMISAAGVAVWLKADLDLLWSRVRHKNTRPLLQTSDPYATLTELRSAREPAYAEADLHVQCAPGLSIEQTAQRVIAALRTRPDVLEDA